MVRMARADESGFGSAAPKFRRASRCAMRAVRGGAERGASQRGRGSQPRLTMTPPAGAGAPLHDGSSAASRLRSRRGCRSRRNRSRPGSANLATLVPPPRIHAIRYHGVFAPNSKVRSRVVPQPAVRDPAAPPSRPRPARHRRTLDRRPKRGLAARSPPEPTASPGRTCCVRCSPSTCSPAPTAAHRLHRGGRGREADPRLPRPRLPPASTRPRPGAAPRGDRPAAGSLRGGSGLHGLNLLRVPRPSPAPETRADGCRGRPGNVLAGAHGG